MPTYDLFDLPPSPLDWLPGESLFSLISRQHAFWGYAGAGETAYILFGHRHAGIHHDFPSALNKFSANTGGALGEPAELALNRTLLAYYRPFASESLIADCILMMRGKSVTHLKFRLGLLTSRFRANHPLKACTACMEQDRADTGWAYWHLEHQFPGVWFCQLHGEPLYESTVKSTGVGRFLWSLPDRFNLTCDWMEKVADISALKKLSRMTSHLVKENRGTGWLDGALTVPVLREMVRQQGGLTPNGNLRSSKLAPSYLAWCQCLNGPLELDALPQSQSEASTQVGRLLRDWRTGTHPLRVLVAASWLFADAESFIAAYEALHGGTTHSPNMERHGGDSTPLISTYNDAVKAQLVELVQAGKSATAAASAVGVTVGTAMAWLAQANVKVERRPKSFKTEIQNSLKKDLVKGMSKSTAATTHGISVQAITRFLRTEPGLHQTWQDAVFKNVQTKARKTWSSSLEKFGHLGTKWIRAQEPSIYAWLYRNDRVWLQSNQPPVLARSASNVHINWDHRDLALSAAAEKVVEKLKAGQSNKPLHLWLIYQAMPELKPKLSALDKLPLTRRVIERALGHVRKKPHEGLL